MPKRAELWLLLDFLFGMTGTPALGTKGLTIKSLNAIAYHTCFNSVDLPFDLIQDDAAFNKILNDSLRNIAKYTSA